MTNPAEILLADADVLIDYVQTDLSILRLVANHTGRLYVLREVLETVDGLSNSRCRRNGIEVIETETAMLLEAGKRSGALSFEDWLCYLHCEQRHWICVTNDSALIQACKNGGVSCRRGLRLMIDLVVGGYLPRAKALRTARAIHQINPLHINDSVLEQFIRLLNEK